MPTKMVKFDDKHPGIWKRGSRYVVMWRDVEGKRRKDSFRTLTEAVKFQGRTRQDGGNRAHTRARFADYAQEWIDTYRGRTTQGVSEATRKSYRRSLDVWAVPFFGKRKLADIAPPDMRRFVAHMESEGLRPPSIRKHMTALKALFATAYEDGQIPANPVAGLRLNIGRDDLKRTAKALTREELALVLAALPEDWRPFFAFLAQTGLRISEAAGLSWEDVELTTRPHVRVRHQWRDRKLVGLKTTNSRRDVPLSQGSVDALLQRRASHYTGEHGPVWSTPAGTRLIPGNLRSRVLHPITEPLGLDWVGLHTFRHTCASLMFASATEGGGAKNVKQVAAVLGHSDPAFTMSVYVHLMGDGVGSMDFMDAALSARPGGTGEAPRRSQTDADASAA